VKLKQAREDFVVEEVLRLEGVEEGPFTLYRLTKEGIGTIEALRYFAQAWRLPRDAVGFAGLKDRHGQTVQTVSVRGGRAREYVGRTFRLDPVGYSRRAVDRSALAGNRFRLLVRDLSRDEAKRVADRARDAARHGFPDYYDDQRFGSMRGTEGALVAEALLRGDPERALRLAIASPAREDRSRVRSTRRLLAERWGRWDEILPRLAPSPEHRLVERLAGGASFGEVYDLLDRDLRSLHLAAWQAWVFNECLRRMVASLGGGPGHAGLAGSYVFYEGDPGPLRGDRIPLPSREAEPHPVLDAVLAERGITRETLAALPFRRGLRDAVVVPEELEVGPSRPDDRNRGRFALPLSFVLGPGSYATMLVKRCTWDIEPRGRARRRRPRDS
jgi:tRNA pseudouridine13 synthase